VNGQPDREYGKSQIFDRTYSEFDFVAGGVPLHLVPVHLMHAWDKVAAENPGVWGTLMSLALIAGAGENPIAHQIEEYRDLLSGRFPELARTPVLVVGDFNVPGPFSSYYWQIGQGLKDVYGGSAKPTFPARSADEAGHYPPLKIDHSFRSQALEITGAEVLPLAGGDHYPLFFVARPATSGHK
jgi:endonuclease/exonuclease/phosphatase family metal-dependent hydrolase